MQNAEFRIQNSECRVQRGRRAGPIPFSLSPDPDSPFPIPDSRERCTLNAERFPVLNPPSPIPTPLRRLKNRAHLLLYDCPKKSNLCRKMGPFYSWTKEI